MLSREQSIAVAAVVLLLAACGAGLALGLQARSDAGHELAERQEVLARLEARLPSGGSARPGAAASVAPPAAFLEAPTEGLAGAQLQAYLSQVALNQRAVVISSGVQATAREDASETIRVQATLDIPLKSLQAMLYQLESGTPYVFVEGLNIQPPSSAAQHGAQDPVLRVTLKLRSVWRRGTG